jgi:hypothetical protein
MRIGSVPLLFHSVPSACGSSKYSNLKAVTAPQPLILLSIACLVSPREKPPPETSHAQCEGQYLALQWPWGLLGGGGRSCVGVMVYLIELLSVMLPPCFQFMAFVSSFGRLQPLLGYYVSFARVAKVVALSAGLRRDTARVSAVSGPLPCVLESRTAALRSLPVDLLDNSKVVLTFFLKDLIVSRTSRPLCGNLDAVWPAVVESLCEL